MKAESTTSDWSGDGDSDRAASPAPRRPGLSHLLKPVPRPRGGVHHRVIQVDADTFVV